MKINPQIYQNQTLNNSVISSKQTVEENAAQKTVTVQPQIQKSTQNTGAYILSALENLNKLDNLQRLMFLKEMLNLPNEWKDFLIFATLKSNPGAQTNELLNKLLDLNLIRSDLNSSSNEILNKLLKLLTPEMASKSTQMQQMMDVLQKFLPSSEAKSTDILKDLLLMYLPYLPLKEDFKLMLSDKNKGESGEEESDCSIIIILSTKNMGTFKIEIYLENSDIKIQIDSNSDKLNRRFLTKLKDMKKSLEIKNEISIVKNKNLQSSQEAVQNITSSSQKLHPKVLMAAYEIIKVIMEADKYLSLEETRKNS